MSNAKVSRRQSFILRFTRPPEPGAPETAWSGSIQATPLDIDEKPAARGFRDLNDVPSIIVELLSQNLGDRSQ